MTFHHGDQSMQGLLAQRYLLMGEIGRGAHAVVLRASDTKLNRAVAVKMFALDGNPAALPRFHTELHTMACLNHPDLLHLYDGGIDLDDSLHQYGYLVYELLPTTLAQRVRGSTLNWSQTADIGFALASGLAYLHRNGFVHRDVKPANVLLDNPLREADQHGVRLADFGIAARLGPTGELDIGSIGPLNVEPAGTVPYFSPEQVTGEPLTTASDVYALGLLLIECLTGAPVYPDGGDLSETALERLRRRPEVPPRIRSRISKPAQPLFTAMCNRDPRSRPSAAEIAVGLRG
ncbi:serine/threonine-protein kinase [Jatrophihabitans sp. DSM 45814]